MKYLIIAGLFLITSCFPSIEPDMVGTYRLIDWQMIQNDSVTYPYGADASGQLQYSADGGMSLQLNKGKRNKFGTLDRSALDSEASARAYTSYFAYWGTFQVNQDSGLIYHFVEECLHPDWNHTTQTRMFKIQNDTLYLSTEKGDRLRFKKYAKEAF